jgi:hypothetical protein
VNAPRQACQTVPQVGSATIAPAALESRHPSAASRSAPRRPPVSSSGTTTRPIRLPASAATRAAWTIAATPPFMSEAPRPIRRPSTMRGWNCSGAKAGTTS